MATCFHCGHEIIWQADFDFEDYCLEGQGIVQVCYCPGCGADIEYRIPIPDAQDTQDVRDVQDTQETQDVQEVQT